MHISALHFLLSFLLMVPTMWSPSKGPSHTRPTCLKVYLPRLRVGTSPSSLGTTTLLLHLRLSLPWNTGALQARTASLGAAQHSLVRKNLGPCGQREQPKAKGGGSVAKPQKLISQSRTRPETPGNRHHRHLGPHRSPLSHLSRAVLGPSSPCPACARSPSLRIRPPSFPALRPPARGPALLSRCAPSWSPPGPFHTQSRVFEGTCVQGGQISILESAQLSPASLGISKSRVPIFNREEVACGKELLTLGSGEDGNTSKTGGSTCGVGSRL